jgi:hypothetical protein
VVVRLNLSLRIAPVELEGSNLLFRELLPPRLPFGDLDFRTFIYGVYSELLGYLVITAFFSLADENTFLTSFFQLS